MKLEDINPFLPKDESERKIIVDTYKRELQVYRKKPVFWGSVIIYFICLLVLILRLDMIGKVLLILTVCSFALIHDTITSHFTKRLVEEEKKRIGNS